MDYKNNTSPDYNNKGWEIIIDMDKNKQLLNKDNDFLEIYISNKIKR